MLNQQSEQSFLKNMDAAEASAAIAFIGENASEDGEICPDLDSLRHEEGFFLGQQVYERDTLAPGTIIAIDEDGIAEVLFSNGSTDGVNLEHLTSVVDSETSEEAPCTGCENGCDQCLDPLMAGYEGCYHKDGILCDCTEQYRLHQVWTYSSDASAVCTCRYCQSENRG